MLQMYKYRVFLLLFLSIIMAGTLILAPQLITEFYQTIFKSNSHDNLLLMIVILLILLYSISTFFYDFFVNNISEHLTMEFRKKIFYKSLFMENNLTYSSNQFTSMLNNDLKSLQSIYSDYLLNLIKNSFILLATLSMLLILNFMATLVIFITIILLGIIGNLGVNQIKKDSESIQSIHTRMIAFIQDSLNNLVMIKVFNGSKYIFNKYLSFHEDALKLVTKRNLKIAMIKPLTNLFMYLLLLVTIYLSFELFSGNDLQQISSYFFYAFILTASVTQVSTNLSGIKKELGTINRILNIDESFKNHSGNKNLIISKGNIIFESVTFSYDEKNIFNQLSFSLEGGKLNTLSGRSGIGKSTIIKLILKQIQPNSGVISIDNQNIEDLILNEYYNNFGVVFQEPYLVNDTILNNLTLGLDCFEMEKVEAICKSLNLIPEIMELPDNFNTIINEQFNNFSRGQAQRLSIARVLLRKPKVIILDEATASLDDNNEESVFNALKTYCPNSTVIMITHNRNIVEKYSDNNIELESLGFL
ncbi:MAG TPA: ABC transporter ATP-binding protein [Pseudogracilibacillus sp.]|nr:ABC transporter ATP-binding protein [Pseudogracilibacillus sp.]